MVKQLTTDEIEEMNKEALVPRLKKADKHELRKELRKYIEEDKELFIAIGRL